MKYLITLQEHYAPRCRPNHPDYQPRIVNQITDSHPFEFWKAKVISKAKDERFKWSFHILNVVDIPQEAE